MSLLQDKTFGWTSPIGQVLKSNYRVDSLINQGGMSWMYKATHLTLNEPVAVKILFPQLLQDTKTRMRFMDEARIQFKLRHSNIVQIIDLITEDNLVGIVMEWVEGMSLKDYIIQRSTDLSLGELYSCIKPLLEALQVAHTLGVVHRDLKPSNIMLVKSPAGRELTPKLSDFGVAKFSNEQRTETGVALGTFQYMPPEQIRDSKSVDHRADIYGIGMVLYELIAGRLPFEGNMERIIFDHFFTQPPSPSEFNPGFPEVLCNVVLKCIHKDPDARFQSCHALAQALEEVMPTHRKMFGLTPLPEAIINHETSNLTSSAYNVLPSRGNLRDTGSFSSGTPVRPVIQSNLASLLERTEQSCLASSVSFTDIKMDESHKTFMVPKEPRHYDEATILETGKTLTVLTTNARPPAYQAQSLELDRISNQETLLPLDDRFIRYAKDAEQDNSLYGLKIDEAETLMITTELITHVLDSNDTLLCKSVHSSTQPSHRTMPPSFREQIGFNREFKLGIERDEPTMVTPRAKPRVDATIETPRAKAKIDATIETEKAKAKIDSTIETSRAKTKIDSTVETEKAILQDSFYTMLSPGSTSIVDAAMVIPKNLLRNEATIVTPRPKPKNEATTNSQTRQKAVVNFVRWVKKDTNIQTEAHPVLKPQVEHEAKQDAPQTADHVIFDTMQSEEEENETRGSRVVLAVPENHPSNNTAPATDESPTSTDLEELNS